MNSDSRASRAWFFCAAFLVVAVSGFGQQITFPDFTSTAGLQLNGSSQAAVWNAQNVLRLTDGLAQPEAGTAFFTTKQPVAGGFTTYFKFQMHTPSSAYNVADGISFIVQNAASTDPNYGGSGAGTSALGYNGGGMGYTGIPNSVAVEFDIYANSWDPEVNNNTLIANHVAVQTCGTSTNTPAHVGGTTILNETNVPSCLLSANAINTNIPKLSGTCDGPACTDGPVHEVVIEYTPPANPSASGTLQVWIDPAFYSGTHTPTPNSPAAISVPYTIGTVAGAPQSSTELLLDSANGGSAWVGFTGAQGASTNAQDILAWEFTPHVPSQISQTIPDGGTTNAFHFGAHNYKVTYPVGFTNPTGIKMVVTATPISQADFGVRVQNTPYASEQCIVYEGTGGNCMVYSVSCTDSAGNPLTCPSESTSNIDIVTSYDTIQTISNPDFLKAPTGTNNWESIFTSFVTLRIDGTTAGKGNSFSDFVATTGGPSIVAAPVITCTPPSSTQWYAGNVTVPCTATSTRLLADPTQSNFTLTTSVPYGNETASAPTNSVQVCDVSLVPNCSTSQIYTFKVDEKPPSITITTPASGATYQLNAPITAQYSCVDGGSGVASCAGPVANGSRISTAAVGSFSFTVHAADAVGNLSAITNSYSVGFGNACLLYNPSLKIKHGLPVPILIYLCDASKKNVSKSSIHLHAVQLNLVGSNQVFPIIRDNNNDIDDDFQFVPIVNLYTMIVKTSTAMPAGTYNLVYTVTGDPNQHTLSFLLTN